MPNLIGKIFEWSLTRPAWQQDAIRRLWGSHALADADLSELAELCKKPHGLSDTDSEPNPFEPVEDETTDSVVALESITHNANVNALAPNQKIVFGPNLTVIYGENGAGKSGYARILKSACRARGEEPIMGNVLSGEAPGAPSATISLSVAGDLRTAEWKDDQPEPLLHNVSVFDSTCASVYLKDKTDVAYRPFGLDLFDRLSEVCTGVRSILEKEKRELQRSAALPDLPPKTEASTAVGTLSAMTSVDELRRVATLSEEESSRRVELIKQIRTLEETDPSKAIKEIELRAKRIHSLVTIIARIEEFSPSDRLSELKSCLTEIGERRTALENLKGEAFAEQPLEGTGNEAWLTMWKAAEEFSCDHAFPGQDFPVGGERCVLCQQKLTAEGDSRFELFRSFLESDLAKQSTELQNKADTIVAEFQGQALGNIDSTTSELALESKELGESVALWAKSWAALTEAISNAKSADELPEYEETEAGLAAQVKEVSVSLSAKATELSEALNPDQKSKLLGESKELEARHTLGQNLAAYIEEIERYKRLGTYELALRDTETNTITRKSTELTRETVTGTLVEGFQREIKALKFRHIEVELIEAGGGRGVLFHKLSLKRAQGTSVAKVVSEGEARCLAFAAFFAELSTGNAASPVVFDDPVSSLDHRWREHIANRLVEESAQRQVVVFTHDIVLLLALQRIAHGRNTAVKFQYVRREQHLGSGITTEDLPWPALETKKRIGVLKNQLQHAEKVFRTEGVEPYNAKAINIYGLLRETWERAVEEVLLAGVIERYRNSVQTLRASKLTDISKDDLTTLESGMTKASRWLAGHDQAAAEGVPVPEPDELKGDIAALEGWVKDINARRK